MEQPKFLEGIYPDLRRLTIHFVNSSAIRIQFTFENNYDFFHMFFYLCCNQQLRIAKEKMNPKTATLDPLNEVREFFERSDYKEAFRDRGLFLNEFRAYATTIPSELKSITAGRQGFNSYCKSGLFTRCETTLGAWRKESLSKSFVALTLAQSFIQQKEVIPIQISIPQDASQIKTNVKDGVFRTIWGVGPSGCGKSFMTSQITPIIDVQTVLALDGGFFRQCSNVWMVATTDHPYGENIEDLYDAFKGTSDVKGFFDRLFQSVQCSLYIPDTLVLAYVKNFASGLLSYMKPFNERKQVYKFTGQELPYVGICIMQHCWTCPPRKGCTFPPQYRCKGCDKSGLDRAPIEGKTYSNKTYDLALKVGYRAVFVNPQTKSRVPIFIHNSGQIESTSVLVLGSSQGDLAAKLANSIFKVIRVDSFPFEYESFEQMVLYILYQVNNMATSVNVANPSFFDRVKTYGRSALASSGRTIKNLATKPLQLSYTSKEDDDAVDRHLKFNPTKFMGAVGDTEGLSELTNMGEIQQLPVFDFDERKDAPGQIIPLIQELQRKHNEVANQLNLTKKVLRRVARSSVKKIFDTGLQTTRGVYSLGKAAVAGVGAAVGATTVAAGTAVGATTAAATAGVGALGYGAFLAGAGISLGIIRLLTETLKGARWVGSLATDKVFCVTSAELMTKLNSDRFTKTTLKTLLQKILYAVAIHMSEVCCDFDRKIIDKLKDPKNKILVVWLMHIFNNIFAEEANPFSRFDDRYSSVIQKLAGKDETQQQVVKTFLRVFEIQQCDTAVNFCKESKYLESMIRKLLYARELQLRRNSLFTAPRKEDEFNFSEEDEEDPADPFPVSSPSSVSSPFHAARSDEFSVSGPPSNEFDDPIAFSPSHAATYSERGPASSLGPFDRFSIGGRRQRTRRRRRRSRRS